MSETEDGSAIISVPIGRSYWKQDNRRTSDMVIAAKRHAEALTADYDENADVLYIAVGQPRPG